MESKHIFSELKPQLGQFTLLLYTHRPPCKYCVQREARDVKAQCKIHPLLGTDSQFSPAEGGVAG